MTLTDAGPLVALAEDRGLGRIFTLDSDFRVYRLRNRKALAMVP